MPKKVFVRTAHLVTLKEHGWNQPITSLTWIGTGFYTIIHNALGLNQNTMVTLKRFVQFVVTNIDFIESEEQRTEQVKIIVGTITKSSDARRRYAGYYGPVLKRDVHRFAFSALIDLLDHATTDPSHGLDVSILPDHLARHLICGWLEGNLPVVNTAHRYCGDVPGRGRYRKTGDPVHNQRIQAIEECPAVEDEQSCHTKSATCMWSPRDGGGCLPRFAYNIDPQHVTPVGVDPDADWYYPGGLPPEHRWPDHGRYVRYPEGYLDGSVYVPWDPPSSAMQHLLDVVNAELGHG